MANVRLTCSRVNGDMSTNQAGDMIEVSAEEATRLIEADLAAPVEEAKPKKSRKQDDVRPDTDNSTDGAAG